LRISFLDCDQAIDAQLFWGIITCSKSKIVHQVQGIKEIGL
jgi:hypothetical protein